MLIHDKRAARDGPRADAGSGDALPSGGAAPGGLTRAAAHQHRLLDTAHVPIVVPIASGP